MHSIKSFFIESRLFDCHVNLFGASGIYKYPINIPYIVSCDDRIDDKSDLLDEFKKVRGVFKCILLNGNTPTDLDNIIDLFEGKFIGFGEIKCYKRFKGDDKDVNIYKTDVLLHAIKRSRELGRLPISVHWDLTGEHDDEFEYIISNNRDIPFVLCHCGIPQIKSTDNEKTISSFKPSLQGAERSFKPSLQGAERSFKSQGAERSFKPSLQGAERSFQKASQLQKKYNNLWMEISWSCLDFLYDNPIYINQLVKNRVIIGTDYQNPKINDNFFENIYPKFVTMDRYFGYINVNNIRALYEI